MLTERPATRPASTFPPSPSRKKVPDQGNRQKRDRLQREKRALLELAKAHFSRSRDLEASFRKITEVAVRCLEIHRAAIWLISDDKTTMRCHQLFAGETGRHSSGNALKTRHYSAYLRNLKKELVMTAASVETNPHFKEFWDYMRPLGIASAIDAGIRSNGHLIGFIRFETTRPRKWTSDEERFAVSLAEVVALAIKEDELRRTDTLSRSFAELGRKLNACTTPRMAARLIGRTAQKLWGWDALYLHLYDQAAERLLPVIAFDTINGRKVQVRLVPEQPVLRDPGLLQNKKLLVNGPNALNLNPFGDVKRLSQSRMYITIENREQTLALFSIQSYSPNAYDERALEGLEALGEYCTGAVARLQAEALRRESEERFRCLADATTEGILIHSATGIFEVNAELGRIFGYSTDELKKRSLADLLLFSEKKGTGKQNACEGVGIRNDGSHFPLEVVTRTCRYRGKPAKVTVIRDISDRKGIEHQLRDHSRKILEAQEAERYRVSRDLHDSVNQLLTAAQYSLELLAHSVEKSSQQSHAHLQKTLDLVGKAMEEIRIISWNLRPNELDHLGLPIAIRALCRDCEERTGIVVSFEYPANPGLLDKDAAVTLFRIVQEGLSNACRYSAARQINIKVRWAKTALTLEIGDNGIGFSPAAIRPVEGKMNGLGLLNMRERASSAGGSLHLETAPGKGTRIRVRLPLKSVSPEVSSGKTNSRRKQKAVTNQKKSRPSQQGIKRRTRRETG